MQWRSIVVGLVVLRLSVSLWLAFGLGAYVSLGTSHTDGVAGSAEEPSTGERKGNDSWSKRISGYKHEETTGACAVVTGESPKRSYMSFFDGNKDDYVRRYSSFPGTLKVTMKEKAREMFYFGYDNYMKYAFPKDELNPIDCEGRGPDVLNP